METVITESTEQYWHHTTTAY